MTRKVGTVSRGLRCPIIRQDDDLASIVVNSVLEAKEAEGFSFYDRDIVAMTESIVARAQGNYVSVDAIAVDVKRKFDSDTIGVIFPILSRNRFSMILKGLAQGMKKIILMLSYPSDEVGNELVSWEQLDASNVNPHTDVLTLEQYRAAFGKTVHPFTGMDYVEYYQQIIEEQGCEVEIIFGNHPKDILAYCNHVLTCDIHSAQRTKKILNKLGVAQVLGLEDLMNQSIEGSGYNESYGLLGSNKSTDNSLKLFPRDCQDLVLDIQKQLLEKTNRHFEVMVYGDGAFKDPVGKIWELADPTVSPAYTPGLDGTPNELKLKYLADDEYKNLSGKDLQDAISYKIKDKGNESLVGRMAAQGTTPRRFVDLIGSLCDLTSGSGDKGTPIVLVQGYFDNFADE